VTHSQLTRSSAALSARCCALRTRAGVAQALAEELSLLTPIHGKPNETSFLRLPRALGLCTGTLAKIARDISLHAHSEIAELAKRWRGEGRGGSSNSCRRKEQPIPCATGLAAASVSPGLLRPCVLFPCCVISSAAAVLARPNGKSFRKCVAFRRRVDTPH